MMKKTILLFILCLPLVYSLYGGETFELHINNCIGTVGVIVEASHIDEGEYWLENCTKSNKTYDWICNCSETVDILFHTMPNTVNKYNITALYPLEQLPCPSCPPVSGGSGGGGGGGWKRTVYQIPEEPEPITVNISEPPSGGGGGEPSEPIDEEEPINITRTEPELSKAPAWPWILLILLVALIILGGILQYKRKGC